MSKGLGGRQRDILTLLLHHGGVLTMGAILVGLFGKVSHGTEGYNRAHSTLSRSLAALRGRGLIKTYQGIQLGSHAILVASLTVQGIREARKNISQKGA